MARTRRVAATPTSLDATASCKAKSAHAMRVAYAFRSLCAGPAMCQLAR